jgi:DNA-binding Lrp family transcriptional regulator
MKDIELKLISELMKNSRKSDREIAKTIGVSQPTVTRTRTRLEKEGIIKEYTTIPDFAKLGYQLMAVTLAKLETPATVEVVEKTIQITRQRSPEWPEVIMVERVTGMGYNGIVVSFHRDYSSYITFKRWLEEFSYLGFSSIDSVMINLEDKVHYKSLTFSTLAEHILKREKEEKP